jgi:peptidoglycan/LPS O-acetylase OafA/YrhL
MVQYRKEIDGLRALAVLGVFFFHLDWPFFPGGWLGVDVFFVLSGFLISSLLLKEMDTTGTISLTSFYQRRIRRIMPALLVCLIGSMGVGLFISGTHFFSQYIESYVAALLSASNIYFWQHSGYFSLESSFVPLLHTWTLGVEEQFYFIIPVVFCGIAKLAPRGKVVAWWSVFLVILASFLTCRYGKTIIISDGFNFYMLPTRLWELGIGTLTALLLHRREILQKHTLVHELIGLTSVAWLCFAFTHYEGNSYFAEKSLFTCIATALFIITVSEQTIVGRLFSTSPMRFVGKISYSLYLFHWPLISLWAILAFKHDLEASIGSQLAIIAVAIILATLSWKYVESPFRQKKTWKECLVPLTPLVTAAVGCALVGFIFLNTTTGEVKAADRSRHPIVSFEELVQGNYPHWGPEGKPEFMLIGDSHARNMGYVFSELAEEYGVVGTMGTASSTSPLPKIRPLSRVDEPPFAHEWIRHIDNYSIEHIFLISKWDSFQARPEGFINLKSRKKCSSEGISEELRALVASLLDKGCHVWILRQVPSFKKDPTLAVRLIDINYGEDISVKNDFIDNTFPGELPAQLSILDASPYLLEGNTLRARRNGEFLYYDPHHLTKIGAIAVKDVFRPAFEQMSLSD